MRKLEEPKSTIGNSGLVYVRVGLSYPCWHQGAKVEMKPKVLPFSTRFVTGNLYLCISRQGSTVAYLMVQIVEFMSDNNIK